MSENSPTVEGAITTAARPVIDAETFASLQERRSEIGSAGELLVVQDELERLRNLGCHAPEQWVKRVALSDVGRGYDVESTWPGEERYIEVKTTTRSGSDFFLTTNERTVLTNLDKRAWLYRVVLGMDGIGHIVSRLQNPMAALNPEAFEPVLWRVTSAD